MGTASVAAETVEAIRRAQRTAEKIEQGLIKAGKGRSWRMKRWSLILLYGIYIYLQYRNIYIYMM